MSQTKQCFECGAPSSHDHHVVPKSFGGTKTIPLCERCHGIIHDISFSNGGINHSMLTMQGMKNQATKGYAIGTVPLGYEMGEDGKLNMNASEQITIQIIHELAGRGMSVRKIAARLNDLRRPCRGNAWHKTTVHRILSGSTLKPTQCELIKGQPHDT